VPGRPVKTIAQRSVFLNIPFDRDYEEVFIGIIAGLITVGLMPRSVLEVPDTGDGRMARLFKLLDSCGASIHDLSRVDGKTPRFNMPFELGLAFAMKQLKKGGHSFFVFEEKKYRLDRNLSDLKMIDPRIHKNCGRTAIKCVHECFHPKGKNPPSDAAAKIYGILQPTIPRLRRGGSHLFNRLAFDSLIAKTFGMFFEHQKASAPKAKRR